MAMNPGIKAAWGAWLLEHADDQGTGALCQINEDSGKEEFCCLGGLCELAIAAGIAVGGTIVRVDDIVVTGHVSWGAELLEDARQHAIALAGEPLY
jgi:hypothetical protein